MKRVALLLVLLGISACSSSYEVARYESQVDWNSMHYTDAPSK